MSNIFRISYALPFLLDLCNCEDSKNVYLSAFVTRSARGNQGTYQIPVVDADGVSHLTRADFENTVRSGIPTVFKGVAADWTDMRALSCEDYSKRWPNASMRVEYTGNPEPETFLKLGDSSWVNAEKAPVGMNAPDESCDDEESRKSRPEVSPFVWHVKDRVSRSIKNEIGSLFKGLPWLESGSLLDEQTKDSLEFWFQRVGAGTFAHNDAYCHSVFSVQLRGKKKWRLMVTPEVNSLSRDVFDEFDSGIYKSVHKWEPDLEYVLEEGDGLLFPPGFMHETRTLEGPSDSPGDQCGTSVTFNIPIPMPSKYVREFLPRFSVSREIHHCTRRWESFVTAKTSRIDWEEPFANSTQPDDVTDDILNRVDLNKDGKISVSEVSDYLENSEEGDEFRNQKNLYFGDLWFGFDPRRPLTDAMFTEALKTRAVDTLNMWDLNEDGFASRFEIFSVVRYFHYYKWRQELVDSALTVVTEDEGPRDLPIGSDMFVHRLKLVESIMERVNPVPPSLEVTRRRRGEDEL